MTKFSALPAEEQWKKVLIEGHKGIRAMRWVNGRLPSAPRCKLCNNPFAGVAGRIYSLIGQKPSRKNPNMCSRCCEDLPSGGAEVDTAVLFADVRGSTKLGEQTDPATFAALMNRFYKAATAVIIRYDGALDKLVGDEVMALFIPGMSGTEYRRRAVEAGVDLLRAVGYGTKEGPWLSVGVGVNAGVAYVGNVGGEGILDFTALGDTVNVAARLQSIAEPGELVVSEDIVEPGDELLAGGERRVVRLKGHEAPVSVVVRRP